MLAVEMMDLIRVVMRLPSRQKEGVTTRRRGGGGRLGLLNREGGGILAIGRRMLELT
jgi:hypothetical protein